MVLYWIDIGSTAESCWTHLGRIPGLVLDSSWARPGPFIASLWPPHSILHFGHSPILKYYKSPLPPFSYSQRHSDHRTHRRPVSRTAPERPRPCPAVLDQFLAASWRFRSLTNTQIESECFSRGPKLCSSLPRSAQEAPKWTPYQIASQITIRMYQIRYGGKTQTKIR
jgi:hypothetical protein